MIKYSAIRMRLPYRHFGEGRIIGKDSATVAVVTPWAVAQGHADFIVHVSNTHYELTRRAADVLEWLEGQANLPGAMPARVKKLRQALEAAEVQEQ